MKNVRLSDNECDIIKSIIFDIFGKSRIFIFGSRIDLTKKGGDIDIFVIPESKENLFEKKLKAEIKLEENLFKPVDVVVHRDFNREIEKEALKGVEIEIK